MSRYQQDFFGTERVHGAPQLFVARVCKDYDAKVTAAKVRTQNGKV